MNILGQGEMCNETVAVMKDYNVRQHYETTHNETVRPTLVPSKNKKLKIPWHENL
jgi:hypothetical protein